MAIFIAGIHHLGLAIAFAAFIFRAVWFKQALSLPLPQALSFLKRTHGYLALGLFLSISTGFYRLFGKLDNGVAFYMKNGLFHAKLGIVFLIVIIEAVSFMMSSSWASKAIEDSGYTLQAKDIKKLKIAFMIKIHAFVSLPFLAAAVARGVGL